MKDGKEEESMARLTLSLCSVWCAQDVPLNNNLHAAPEQTAHRCSSAIQQGQNWTLHESINDDSAGQLCSLKHPISCHCAPGISKDFSVPNQPQCATARAPLHPSHIPPPNSFLLCIQC